MMMKPPLSCLKKLNFIKDRRFGFHDFPGHIGLEQIILRWGLGVKGQGIAMSY